MQKMLILIEDQTKISLSSRSSIWRAAIAKNDRLKFIDWNQNNLFRIAEAIVSSEIISARPAAG